MIAELCYYSVEYIEWFTLVITIVLLLQLHLSTGSEYFLVDMGNTKWKVSYALTSVSSLCYCCYQIRGAHDGDTQLVCSTLLHISPPSPLLMSNLDRFVNQVVAMHVS